MFIGEKVFFYKAAEMHSKSFLFPDKILQPPLRGINYDFFFEVDYGKDDDDSDNDKICILLEECDRNGILFTH